MKLFAWTLKSPLGRKHHVSPEAAEIALAWDNLTRFAPVAAYLATAVEILKKSSEMVTLIEKTRGEAGVAEALKNFPHPNP